MRLVGQYDATGIVTAALTYRAGRAVVEFTVRMSCTTYDESKKIYIVEIMKMLVEMINLFYS
jgi:hypothetical protein